MIALLCSSGSTAVNWSEDRECCGEVIRRGVVTCLGAVISFEVIISFGDVVTGRDVKLLVDLHCCVDVNSVFDLTEDLRSNRFDLTDARWLNMRFDLTEARTLDRLNTASLLSVLVFTVNILSI